MKNKVKKYCLIILAMCPVVAVAFAAQSALQVAQIRERNASDFQLKYTTCESPGTFPADEETPSQEPAPKFLPNLA